MEQALVCSVSERQFPGYRKKEEEEKMEIIIAKNSLNKFYGREREKYCFREGKEP